MLLYDVHKKSDRGFTLIEMITAVIIVGVLASIAAPNFLGLLNQNRVKEGLGEVEGAIKESQRLAIRRGKTCKIRLTSTGSGSNKTPVIQVRPNEGSVSYSGCLLSTRTLPSAISLRFYDDSTTITDIDSGSPRDIVFSGKGNTSTEGTIVISRTGTNTTKCLQIKGLLGNILTGDYDSSATPSCQAK